jgi:hypothetical protein
MNYVLAQDLAKAVDATIQTSLRNLPEFKSVKCKVLWSGGYTAGTAWQVDIGSKGGRYLQSKINMPTLPATASVSRFQADVMTGFAIHEMGHNICTDINVWKEACKKGSAYASILNAFEDPRMEYELVQKGRFAGARKNLELLTEYCVKHCSENNWDPADPTSLSFSINTLAYVELCGYDVPSASKLLERAGPLASHIRMWVDKLKLCTSTADAWALTQEFVEYYPQDKKQDEPEQSNYDAGEAGVAGDDAGEAGEAGDDAGEAGDDAGEAGEAGEAGDEAGDDAGTGLGQQINPDAEGGSVVDNINPLDQLDAERDVKSMAEDIKNSQPETHGLNVSNDVRLHSVNLEGGSAKSGKQRANEIRAMLPKNVAAAKQRITRLLSNPDKRGALRNRDKGRLDVGKLHRLSTNNQNIFTNPWKRSGYKTAVGVMVDNSSSMNGSDNHDAVKLALVLGDAMSAANIKFSMASFPHIQVSSKRKQTVELGYVSGSENFNMYGPKAENGMAHTHEYDNNNIGGGGVASTTLKPFSAPWSKADGNITTLWGNTSGSTPMAEALLAMATQMRDMSEDKKVIFILTDGGSGGELLKQTVRMSNLWGIKVVGLEIAHYGSDKDFTECLNANVWGRSVSDILNDLDKLADELA